MMLPKFKHLVLLFLLLNFLGAAAIIGGMFFNLGMLVLLIMLAVQFYYIGLGCAYIGIILIGLVSILLKKNAAQFKELITAILLSCFITFIITGTVILTIKTVKNINISNYGSHENMDYRGPVTKEDIQKSLSTLKKP